MQRQLEKTERELKIRGYSPKTLKSYLYGLREYLMFKKNDFENQNVDNIKDFLLACEKKGASAESRNLFLSAIKFFYQNVTKTSEEMKIRYAKKNQNLPAVLSRLEIEKILTITSNTKHTAYFSHSLTVPDYA